ncbi:hypothetical protein FOXG_19291 [Fusarium oxysporum f. sp. lycopersici 4287]|uniref:Uncharacterized protein n=2 Tax=Fusarium oxysporum TaxID=5507 RepID=A0A0J9UZ74_FUSO4|nr:hypothetical protein FOXG_19291 [Fusarium oxysporum f. sp. lycopersici 4287]EXK23879.1 hypothetical protein FOMG_19370 [Fusarium oxysporum f. sp. melonis 26406]KAJ9419283.1 hypothetical protein QL093DRAFT_1444363 [Fusarium oxysporum]KNB04425.1 hypothetical protein FOXG_19291 [Fusarium oxysporum f. sp. lycopersici 4287]
MNRFCGRNFIPIRAPFIWRGVHKVILHIAAILLMSWLIFRLLGNILSDKQIRDENGAIYHWGQYEPEYKRNLRIVVFGSPDVYGNIRDFSSKRKPWTEELCHKLKCTTYLSFVPQDQPSRGVVSNDLYDKGVQDLLNITKHTDVEEKPALDFNYIAKHYPTPFEVPDLASQVNHFLTTPAQKHISHATIWIFGFGTWEIWNMAAMPRTTSKDIITSMVRSIIDQAEILYEKSLDQKIITGSDSWRESNGPLTEESTASNTLKEVTRSKAGCFLLLVPTLFDISLTPGWQGRLKPPMPNSLAEQTRNAAELTDFWNQEIGSAVAEWNQRTTKKPKRIGSKHFQTPNKGKKTDITGSIQRSKDAKDPASKEHQDESIFQNLSPRRSGLVIEVGRAVLDAMAEIEIQHAKDLDSTGQEKLAQNGSMLYSEVWTPCIQGDITGLTVDMGKMKANCDVENKHLFYDSFTINYLASRNVIDSILQDVEGQLLNLSMKGK